MNNSPSFEPLKNASTNALQEILRQAEVHLQSQLSAAIAADQRSYAFTAVTLASVVLLVGGAYTFENTKPYLAILTALLAVVLFIAAWMASQAARSVQFHFVGSEPRAWCADIADGKQWEHSLAEQCKNYDKVIQSNRDVMERNGRLFNYAVNIALGGTGALGLAFFAMLYWSY